MFTATLYNSTGITLFNIADSEAVLDAAASSKMTVPTMDILQLYFNTKIVIRAFEKDVEQADFLKLTKEAEGTEPAKSAFYSISTYTMTSGDTIELSVNMEPILTAGGLSVLLDSNTKMEGAVSRHHFPVPNTYMEALAVVSNEDDPLFAPSYPTKLELVDEIFAPVIFGMENLLERSPEFNICAVTSINMDAANSVSKITMGTTDPDTGDTNLTERMDVRPSLVTVPHINYQVPGTYDEHIYQTEPVIGGIIPRLGGCTGVLSIMDTDSDLTSFRQDLLKLIANNMTGIVEDIWMAPSAWIKIPVVGSNSLSGTQRTGHIHFFYDLPEEQEGSVPPEFEIGAKIGKYNEYILVATGSGNIKEVRIEDSLILRDNTNRSIFTPVAGLSDPRPDGGVWFAVGKKGSKYKNLQTEKVNNVQQPRGTKVELLDKYDILEGGKWYKVPMNVVGQPGYNASKHAFDMQQQSKDLAADVASVAGLQSYRNTADPVSWAIEKVKSGIESVKLGNQLGTSVNPQMSIPTDSWGGSYDFGVPGAHSYTMDSNFGNGILGGNDRIIGLANREIEKSAELAQFRASVVPQPVVVSKSTGDLDLQGNSLKVFKRSLDDRDEAKYTDLLNRFGYKDSKLFNKSYLNNRSRYNYIECTGLSVKIPGKSKELCARVADALCGGIRIWHVKPDYNFNNNYNPS